VPHARELPCIGDLHAGQLQANRYLIASLHYPMQSGYRLDQLPTDLLIHIRLLLHQDLGRDKSRCLPQRGCQLQLVSRCFRQLEVDIPQLRTPVNVTLIPETELFSNWRGPRSWV
jgi:hypothetical protein